MKSGVFIGVDLGTSLKRKSTGIACIVEHNGQPRINNPTVHIISDDAQIHSSIIQMSGNPGSTIIGIDAPLSRPDHGNMRECEKRLRKHGIPCYPSGAEWVCQWVDKGIELKEWAQHELGARVVEVYPYASRKSLGIGAHVKKKSKRGRRVIQDGLLTLIGRMDEIAGDRLLSDDELDAILSAYTVYCVDHDNAYKMNGMDGAIFLPMKLHDHPIDEY